MRTLIRAVDGHVYLNGDETRVNGYAVFNVLARERSDRKIFVFIPVGKGVITSGNAREFHLAVFGDDFRILFPFGRFVVFYHEGNFEIFCFAGFSARHKQGKSCK